MFDRGPEITRGELRAAHQVSRTLNNAPREAQGLGAVKQFIPSATGQVSPEECTKLARMALAPGGGGKSRLQ